MAQSSLGLNRTEAENWPGPSLGNVNYLKCPCLEWESTSLSLFGLGAHGPDLCVLEFNVQIKKILARGSNR